MSKKTKKENKILTGIVVTICMIIIIAFALTVPLLILVSFYYILLYTPGVTILKDNIYSNILLVVKFILLALIVLGIAQIISEKFLMKANIYNKITKNIVVFILDLLYVAVFTTVSDNIQVNLLGIILITIFITLSDILFTYVLYIVKKLEAIQRKRRKEKRRREIDNK